MKPEVLAKVVEARGRMRSFVDGSNGPICAHDLTSRSGLDPADPGAIGMTLLLAESMARPWRDRPAEVGSALVSAESGSALRANPCDRYFWTLERGAPSDPAGLATFGAEWQGPMLAAKVRAHASQFPRTSLRPGKARGPDLRV